MASDDDVIAVEVAYALPEEQMIIPVRVRRGSSAYEAVVKSGIAEHFAGIDIERDKMGVFGKVIPDPKAYALQPGDRVEIYRPLQIDPKQARANRAAKAKAKQDKA